MTPQELITDEALAKAADIGNSRSLNKAQMKRLIRVAHRMAYRECRPTITLSDIASAENWCAEHGWK